LGVGGAVTQLINETVKAVELRCGERRRRRQVVAEHDGDIVEAVARPCGVKLSR
jgi:hypothetical protein